MGNATQIPLAEYLDTTYRPDCDYIDGELEERNVGKREHARVQYLLSVWFGTHEQEWQVVGYTEQRIHVAPSRVRIADLAFTGPHPQPDVFTEPPLLIIEILSPDDTYSGLQQRCDDYLAMGVQTIWIIDPQTRTGRMCLGHQWLAANRLEVPNTPIHVDLATLFTQLDSQAVPASVVIPLSTQKRVPSGPETSLNALLHAIIPTPCFDRPFVCDGRPESCTVIVIGENPATNLHNEWWEYWDDTKGFDLQTFEDVYERGRRAAGKRPTSNTRLRLNYLRSKGIRCLETNAFIDEPWAGHSANVASDALMQMLIVNLPLLRAVVAHGVVGSRVLSTLSLPDRVQARTLGHFRSLSYASLDSLIETLR